jgi:hypothetical protein
VAEPTFSEIAALLNSDPDTGRLFWHQRARKWRLQTTFVLVGLRERHQSKPATAGLIAS